jgi:hypothetical protein
MTGDEVGDLLRCYMPDPSTAGAFPGVLGRGIEVNLVSERDKNQLIGWYSSGDDWCLKAIERSGACFQGPNLT